MNEDRKNELIRLIKSDPKKRLILIKFLKRIKKIERKSSSKHPYGKSHLSELVKNYEDILKETK